MCGPLCDIDRGAYFTVIHAVDDNVVCSSADVWPIKLTGQKGVCVFVCVCVCVHVCVCLHACVRACVCV